jgi:very-short-patch-repair endonuclease
MTLQATEIAKALRKRMTDAEQILWRHLRAHRLGGMKFKRQQPIGPFVVDFVCFDSRLVIEVDGGQHQDNEKDRTRDAWLEGQGYRVLRFWNNEVLNELPAVLEKIAAIAPPLPCPSPTRGEGVEPAA